MINEIKQIKLDELKAEKSKLDEQILSINKGYNNKKNELRKLQIEQSRGITVLGENFSFLEKHLTRRKEFKKFKEQNKRYKELPILIAKAEQELLAEQASVNEILDKSGINIQLENINQQICSIQSARAISDLGMSPIEAVQFLEDRGIKPVLTEDDKIVTFHPRNYTSKSSLIGVHKTKYAPTSNMIKSSKDANVEYSKDVTLDGVTYHYSYKSARDTVHMAMNDEVSSHVYGSWEDCKYAILVPFDDIPTEKIARVDPQDTFTRGSLNLTENTWILCPQDEVDKLKVFNPNTHIIGYDGQTVKDYSKPFLTQLGYRGEVVGMWNWMDDHSSEEYYELMRKENLKCGTHSYTYFHEDERMLGDINNAVSLCTLIRDNKLAKSPEDMQRIMKQLDEQYNGFGSILSNLCNKTSMEGDLEPESIVGNSKQVDIFIQEMEKEGFTIAPSYQTLLNSLAEIGIHQINAHNIPNLENLFLEVKHSEKETEVCTSLLNTFKTGKYLGYNDIRSAFELFLSHVIGDSILQSNEKIYPNEYTLES